MRGQTARTNICERADGHLPLTAVGRRDAMTRAVVALHEQALAVRELVEPRRREGDARLAALDDGAVDQLQIAFCRRHAQADPGVGEFVLLCEPVG